MSGWGYAPYIPVAQRRANAAVQVKKLLKAGKTVSPVVIEGRRIATSVWGKAWCDNLERYSDYANRLPRGRTYVRNGSVIDLSIAEGKVEALVAGSRIYRVRIDITPATAKCWQSICTDCTGSVGSVVELLQGRLSKNVMERVCREGDGLFPVPRDIKMDCSCPDWAGMCKHVAAVLYGIGARFDADPDALFTLRGVDRSELIAIGNDLGLVDRLTDSDRIIDEGDIAALFDLELDVVGLMTESAAMGQAPAPEEGKTKKSRKAEKTPKVMGEPATAQRASRQTRKRNQTTPKVTEPIEPPVAPLPAMEGNPAKPARRAKTRRAASDQAKRPIRLSVRKKLADSSRTGNPRGRR